MSKKYLLFEIDEGGFNNIRMSFENYVVISYLTKRILVLPPPIPYYLLGGDNRLMSDFFDIDNLKKHITVIYSHEHPINCHTNDEYKQFTRNNCRILDIDSDKDVIVWDSPNNQPNGQPNNQTNNIQTLCCNRKQYNINSYTDKYIYNTGRLINYHTCQIIYKDKQLEKEVKLMLYNAIKYNITIRQNTYKALTNIFRKTKSNPFYAMHIRKGDFQYGEVNHLDESVIIKQVHKLIPRNSYLYILTDQKDKSIFKNLQKYYKVLYYNDISQNVNALSHHTPMIDMGIGTRSILFVGSRLSTFSGYIMIERGFKFKSNIYYTQPPFNKKLIPYNGSVDVYDEFNDLWTQTPNACWQRPYKSFWDV